MANKIKATSKPAAKKSAASKTSAPPWDRDNPKDGDHHTHLSPEAKAAAKRRAKKAGRPYPNLVDNMQAAAEEKK